MPNNFLVTGFGNPQDQRYGPDFGENVLGRNDDESSVGVYIGETFRNGGFKFFGVTYDTIYINNNGNVTFGGPLGEYVPTGIGYNAYDPAIIAPFWMDVDTRLSGRPDAEFDTQDGIYDGNDTLQPGMGNTSSGGNSAGTDLVYWDLDDGYRDGPPGDPTITITWDDVGSYSVDDLHPNAFQLQIIQNSDDTFDIVFRYEATAQATSSSNGPFTAARAGYGVSNQGFEITGSGVASSMEQLASTVGNTGEVGYWRFHVDSEGDITNPLPPAVYNNYPEEHNPPPPPRPVSFSVSATPMTEGNEGVKPFEIHIDRSGPRLDADSVVDWRIVLNDPADLAPDQVLSGTVVFAVGQTSATVIVGVQGDRIFEADEYFDFQLTQVTFGGEVWNPQLIGTPVILNDDPRASYTFDGSHMQTEGSVGSSAFDFVVQRKGDLSFASSAHWEVTNDTSDAQDFAAGQAMAGDVQFAAGQATATIRILVAGDLKAEQDETFDLKLVSSTEGTLVTPLTDVGTTGVILDDDGRATRLVATPSALVMTEGDTGQQAFNFAIMRTGDITAALDTPFAIKLAAGGASAADIASPLTGVVSFAAGSAQAMLSILTNGDTLEEANESFSVTVGGGAFNILTLAGVILNDDKAIGAGSSSPPPISDAPASTFMQMLMGGGLWSDGSAL